MTKQKEGKAKYLKLKFAREDLNKNKEFCRLVIFADKIKINVFKFNDKIVV